MFKEVCMEKEKPLIGSEENEKTFEEFKERLEGLSWKKIASQAKKFIQENPGKAALIGFGLGFLLGYIVRKIKD